MKDIHFTIITVSYNSSLTIEKTIKSILNQTYTHFEYIIVDGRSNDKTLEIINKYSNHFGSKLHLISEPDTGIYNAMNKGIQIAKGDIVGIVNSDDWLEPNTLEIIADAVNEKAILNTIYTGWINFVYNNEKVQLLKTNKKRFEDYAKRYLMGINHPATFVPLSIYKRLGAFDEELNISADIDFVLRARNNGVNFQFVDKVLSNMRDGGASNSFSNKRIRDRRHLLKKHSSNLVEYYFSICHYVTSNYIKLLVPYKLLYAYRYFNRN